MAPGDRRITGSQGCFVIPWATRVGPSVPDGDGLMHIALIITATQRRPSSDSLQRHYSFGSHNGVNAPLSIDWRFLKATLQPLSESLGMSNGTVTGRQRR